LYVFLFMQRTDTKITPVAYNGGGPALIDLLSGRTQMIFVNLPTIYQHIKSGKLRAIAVADLQRSDSLPETPTFEESGFTGLTASTWNAVLSPKGMPAEISARLNREINAILRSQEVKSYLANVGARPMTGTAQQADTFIHDEARKWRKIMVEAGIKME